MFRLIDYRYRISTHTSLAGGDPMAYNFAFCVLISTHTSLAGGDLKPSVRLTFILAISTHTSLAGGDSC